MKYTLLSGLLLLCSSLSAQTQTSIYTPGVTPEGATFCLPKTAIRVSVLTEKRTYQPGEFSIYAQRFLRLNNVSTEPSVVHRVINVKQTAEGVADTSKIFSVKFNNKTSAINVALSEDGTLRAVNVQPEEAPMPTVFQPSPRLPLPDPHQLMTQEILAAGSIAKMAQLTAQEIYDLRDNRNLLIKGQADFMPHDGEQMKMMLQQMDLQDRSLTSLFSGTTTCDTVEHIFYICPSSDIQNQTLFRFSKHFGMVDADDMSGVAYHINVTDLKTVPRTPENAKRKKTENGLYYNVPGRLRSTITCGADILADDEFPAAQFGNVELLSGDLFNKHYGTRIWLHPVTGAIDKLEAEQPK
jgi:hypothetical protein